VPRAPERLRAGVGPFSYELFELRGKRKIVRPNLPDATEYAQRPNRLRSLRKGTRRRGHLPLNQRTLTYSSAAFFFKREGAGSNRTDFLLWSDCWHHGRLTPTRYRRQAFRGVFPLRWWWRGGGVDPRGLAVCAHSSPSPLAAGHCGNDFAV